MTIKSGKVPEKYFYTIGDVSDLTGVKQHILRYWESQLSALRPARRYSGHRKYTIKEVDLINKVRYLIVDRKYTLAGASKEINRQMNRSATAEQPLHQQGPDYRKALLDLKKEIDECLVLMS